MLTRNSLGSYEKQDINSMSKNYVFQLSNEKTGVIGNLTKETFGNMLDDQKQKNGFDFVALNFARMNESFNKMNEICKNLFLKLTVN